MGNQKPYPLYTDGVNMYTSFDGGVTLLSVGNGQSVPVTTLSNALARAQSLLGTGINSCDGDDFGTDQGYVTSTQAGTPSIALSRVDKSGVLLMSSTATANCQGSIMLHGAPSIVDNAQTTPWYTFTRAKLVTGVDTHGYITTAGWAKPTSGNPGVPVVAMGALGSLGTTNCTTNFTLYATDNAGTTQIGADSGVALDTNWHGFEIWSDAAFVYYAIDGVQVGKFANTNVGTNPLTLCMQVANGSTATNRQVDLDKWFWAVAGN